MRDFSFVALALYCDHLTCVQTSGQWPTVVKRWLSGGISWKEETSWPTVSSPESKRLTLDVSSTSSPELSTTFECCAGLS